MDSSQKTILVADDEEDLRLLIEVTLGDQKYRVLTAVDGKAALEHIRQAPPDLLILDWMMPGLTGVEVVKLLRQDPMTTGLPIVLLTAKARQEDQEEARTLGIFAYLVKPFSPLELLQKVQEALEK